ncbi:MAG: alpha/beta hydrolase family protein [Gemmiger sp.]
MRNRFDNQTFSSQPDSPSAGRKPPVRYRGLLAAVLLFAVLALCGVAVLSMPQGWLPLFSPIGSTQTPAAPTPVPTVPIVAQPTELQIPQTRSTGEEVLIPATAVIPQTDAPMPLVVFCHGFTGSRQGDGHYPVLAQRLAQYGIASVALDFPGNGDSTEPFTSYTLENMASDISCVIEAICRTYPIRADKIGLLGHSMGGRVVSLYLNDSIAAAALWSPADNAGLQGLEFLNHDPAALEALHETALQEGSAPAWHVTISSRFIEEMANSDPWASIRQYKGALLLAFAGQDSELLSQTTIDGTLMAANSRGLPFVDLTDRFANATHNFTARPDDPDYETVNAQICYTIESETAEFFRQALLEE